MQHLESARFSKIDRRMNGVSSHKVIGVEGNNLVIAVPSVLSKDGKIPFLMSDTSGIKQGDYVDFCFAYTVTNGRANSYQAQFLGITPPEFKPENGETYTN